jgi:hypothetical protein
MGAWSGLVVLGLILAGCQSPSHEAGTSSHAYAAPAPDCDNTVPLNHCGSYMPEYDPNNGS